MKCKSITALDSSMLDFLRGWSAQLVLLGHLLSFYGFQNEVPTIQNFGVLVFFILSGFLITHTCLVKQGDYDLKDFLIDRFSRIYSAYVPALICVAIIDAILISWTTPHSDFVNFDSSTVNFLVNLGMLHAHPFLMKYAGAEAFGSGRIFWTVSIEWMFYIIFGLIFFYNDYQRKSILKWFLLGTLGFLMVAAIYYIGKRGSGLTLYWLIGLLLAVLYNKIEASEIRYNQFVLFLFVLTTSIVWRVNSMNIMDMYDVGLAFLIMLSMLAVFYINFTKPNSILSAFFKQTKSFNKFIASYSYSLYLVHYTLILVFIPLLKSVNSFVAMALIFIMANLIAYIFALIFEFRYLTIRKSLKNLFVTKASLI